MNQSNPMQCKQIFISGRSDESYHYWCFMFHCAGLSSTVLSPVRGWYICCRRTRLRFCLSSALLVSAERFILVGLRVNCLLCSLYWHVWVRALDETSTPVQRRSLTEQVWAGGSLWLTARSPPTARPPPSSLTVDYRPHHHHHHHHHHCLLCFSGAHRVLLSHM